MIQLVAKKLLVAGFITFVISPAATTVPTTATVPAAVNSGVTSNTSYNWSGYEATGGTFTSVTGTWTIPNVSAASSTEADATWVGIGGVTSHDLIQAGTQAVINGSGAPAYQAWYETLPQVTQQVPLTVSPGDSMSVTLTQTSAGEWSVVIRDNTTGQSYQTSIAYNSSLSSAEWIQEMPSDETNFVPLDNFGSVSFTAGSATENGDTVSIAGANAQALTMVNRAGQTLATTSALGADGVSFTVTRTSASSAASGGGYFVTGGVGRGWRRTGVGVQGYMPRTQPQPVQVQVGSTSGSFGGSAYAQLFQLMQELRQLQQEQLQQMGGLRGGFLRDGFSRGGR
jgi:hypothetical protein